MSKKLATPDPAAAKNGQQLTVDLAQALKLKWAGIVGTPQRVKTGTSWTVPNGFELHVDTELVLEGTGEVILEGDAQINLWSNWVI